MRIGYVRVSTDDQEYHSQMEALDSCDKFYSDKASGKNTDRPGFADMMQFAREGDTIVVWKLDRLARSVSDLVRISQDLQSRGIELKVISPDMDTSTPSGKMLFHIMAAIAEFERELTVERVNAGLAAARAQGRVGGRKPVVTKERLRQIVAAVKENPDLSPAEIQSRWNLSRSTYYRSVRPALASIVS